MLFRSKSIDTNQSVDRFTRLAAFRERLRRRERVSKSVKYERGIMFLIRQSRRALGIAIALICLFPSLAKGQFFEESAVWEGTDSIGREVVLYSSPEGRFYSRYPLLTSATGDGHGVWSIDSADNTIRFRSLSGEVTTFPVDLISRRYTLAKGQEGDRKSVV